MTSSPSSTRHLQITAGSTTAANNNNNHSSSSGLTQHHHHLSPSSPGVTRSAPSGSGGQNQACAACKYQRRKCNPDCPLARYFPADQQRRFLNAHKLFGVGNIQRTLRETRPDLRNDAMRALIYHAEARAYDPVGGCCHILFEHKRQFDLATAELEALRHRLRACRRKQALQAQAQAGQPLLHDGDGDEDQDQDPGMMLLVGGSPHASDAMSVDALYGATAGQDIDYGQASAADHYLLGGGAAHQDPPQPHHMYDYFYYDGPAGDENSSHAWTNADNGIFQQQHFYANNNNGIIVKAGSPGASLGEDDQIETQFFDVKPDIAAAVGMDHDVGSGDDDSFGDHQRLEDKVVATVVKNELLDHHQAAAALQMEAESSAAAVSRCQLELGFSSF